VKISIPSQEIANELLFYSAERFCGLKTLIEYIEKHENVQIHGDARKPPLTAVSQNGVAILRNFVTSWPTFQTFSLPDLAAKV